MAKKKATILTGLDKTFQAAADMINPEQAKGRAAAEQIKQNATAPQSPQAQSPQENLTPTPMQDEQGMQVIRDNTGRVTGVQVNGKVYNGIPKAQTEAIINAELKKTTIGNNNIPDAQTAAQEKNASAQVQQALNQQGQQMQPTVSLDTAGSTQDYVTNAATNIPSIVGGAAALGGTGAAIGTAIAPGVGTIAGGVIGAVVGGVSAFIAKMTTDRRQATKEAYKTFQISSDKRYKEVLNMANNKQDTPADILQAYEINLANIKESKRALRELTRSSVGKQLSGAQEELIQVEEWLRNEPYYKQQVIDALRNPQVGLVYSTQDLNSSGD